jgi:hypothetical protein
VMSVERVHVVVMLGAVCARRSGGLEMPPFKDARERLDSHGCKAR